MITELLEVIVVELCTVIRYNGVGDSILADDVLVDKLVDLCGRDGHKRFCFNPFSEVVYSHYHLLYTTSPFVNSAD